MDINAYSLFLNLYDKDKKPLDIVYEVERTETFFTKHGEDTWLEWIKKIFYDSDTTKNILENMRMLHKEDVEAAAYTNLSIESYHAENDMLKNVGVYCASDITKIDFEEE